MSTKYTLDNINSQLEIFVDEILVTHYDFNNNTDLVTLSERTNQTVVTLPDFKNNVNEINMWEKMLDDKFHPLITPKSPFKSTLKKTNNKVTLDLTINDESLIDASWSQNSNNVTFEPRSEVGLIWVDWVNWTRYLGVFISEISNF